MPAMGSHEIGDHGCGGSRHAHLAMDQDTIGRAERGFARNTLFVGRTFLAAAVDEVADWGEVGKQVMCQAVCARDIVVTVFRDDGPVPGAPPISQSSNCKRDDGSDFVVLQDFDPMGAFDVTKIEAVLDLGDWWVPAGSARHSGRAQREDGHRYRGG